MSIGDQATWNQTVGGSRADAIRSVDNPDETESDESTEAAEAPQASTAADEKIQASKLRDASRKEMDATRLYLKEIEFSALLTADEEKHYTLHESRFGTTRPNRRGQLRSYTFG